MRRRLAPLAAPAVAVVAAAAAALLVAGCGGSSGPKASGATSDAKTAATQLLASLQPATQGLRSVTCGALDFALTYRCVVVARGSTLVCGARSGTAAKPYCLAQSADTAEAARRTALVASALRRANDSGRLARIVANLRRGGFTVGCVLGFRTVQGGSAQTDDVVIELLPVQTGSGRAFWQQVVVAPGTGAGAFGGGTGFDPAKKAATNGYAGCTLDGQGRVAVKGQPRDSALLPGAPGT